MQRRKVANIMKRTETTVSLLHLILESLPTALRREELKLLQRSCNMREKVEKVIEFWSAPIIACRLSKSIT